ncbi:MAG: cytochrome bc complex cytochrome b subunit [Candidatus Riflebacteria bacterium]|nr:cytochrome bc complex cytochrome b subunit [Candidatus Riflebacteria bacterium]
MNPVTFIYDWIDRRIGLNDLTAKYLTGYLLPRNINIWYSMGSILLLIFGVQVLTGILLLVYYSPSIETAFKSITFIMNQVPFGWLIRTCHAVGANMMVLFLLIHMISVIFMGSYKAPREFNWLSGFGLLNMVFGICLTGYLLPWSQLSFWATTVATSGAGSVPFIGEYILEFVRGGKLVGAPTLGRFFVLHVIVLPAGIAGLIGIHLFLLQRTGVSTPPSYDGPVEHWKGEQYEYEKHPDGIPFFPHFLVQDLVANCIYAIFFFAIVFFVPNIFFPAEAFFPANPFETPAHIKPEWYFLPNYQVLKIFPNEFIGLIVQGIAMTFLAALPFIDIWPKRNFLKRPLFLTCVMLGIFTFIGLMIWGHFS